MSLSQHFEAVAEMCSPLDGLGNNIGLAVPVRGPFIHASSQEMSVRLTDRQDDDAKHSGHYKGCVDVKAHLVSS